MFEGLEQTGRLAELAAIILLGTVLSIEGLTSIGWSGWMIVLLALLVIRPASVFIGFVGNRRTRPERAFIAWFGVRGLASIYYAAAIGASGVLAADEVALIWWIAVAPVVASIVVHGLTGKQGMKFVEQRSLRIPR